MRRFPYKPRAPRVPPEAPEPETPQGSDWRLYAIMLRIAFTALIVVAGYAVMLSLGATGGISGILLLVGAIVFATVPRLRERAQRGWYWYWRPRPWWRRHGTLDASDFGDDGGDDSGDGGDDS